MKFDLAGFTAETPAYGVVTSKVHLAEGTLEDTGTEGHSTDIVAQNMHIADTRDSKIMVVVVVLTDVILFPTRFARVCIQSHVSN